MFLAPLNYDRFFKKIFSDERISKRFLEYFFEITIDEFAEKTRNKDNVEQDFTTYSKDDVFLEVIRKLSHKSLDKEDYSFIEYYRMLEGQKDVWEKQYTEEGIKKGKQEGLKEGALQEKIANAENLLLVGVSVEAISKALNLPINDLLKIKERLDKANNG